MTQYLYAWGLNVRSGTEFGQAGEKHLRFTFAASESAIAEGVESFKAATLEMGEARQTEWNRYRREDGEWR